MSFLVQILRSGSSGNCTLVTAGRTRLLIDAGIGPRVLCRELAALGLAVGDLTAAIFTHCHVDHLRGNTLALLAREGVPIHFNEGTWDMACLREHRHALDRFPAKGVRIFDADRPFAIQDLEIEAFAVSHGQPGPRNPAGDPVAFALTDGRDRLGYCTDVGHATSELVAWLQGVGLLVFESNHDVEMERLCARPWPVKQWVLGEAGHLSNGQAAAALAAIFAGSEGGAVILAHLSEMCNTVGLARETTREALIETCEVEVAVANRLHATPPWTLEGGVASRVEKAPELHPIGLFALR